MLINRRDVRYLWIPKSNRGVGQTMIMDEASVRFRLEGYVDDVDRAIARIHKGGTAQTPHAYFQLYPTR